MNRDEYLYPLFEFLAHIDSPIKNGLQRTNIKNENAHQYLFEYDEKTKVRYSKFETDRYGTIKPSDMEKGIALGKIDTIFCGGSGTEAGLVWHGERPSDVFSRITGSGSACIGIFSNMENAIYAQNLIKLKYPRYWCVVAKTM